MLLNGFGCNMKCQSLLMARRPLSWSSPRLGRAELGYEKKEEESGVLHHRWSVEMA